MIRYDWGLYLQTINFGRNSQVCWKLQKENCRCLWWRKDHLPWYPYGNYKQAIMDRRNKVRTWGERTLELHFPSKSKRLQTLKASWRRRGRWKSNLLRSSRRHWGQVFWSLPTCFDQETTTKEIWQDHRRSGVREECRRTYFPSKHSKETSSSQECSQQGQSEICDGQYWMNEKSMRGMRIQTSNDRKRLCSRKSLKGNGSCGR